jgi:hypothetical protein
MLISSFCPGFLCLLLALNNLYCSLNLDSSLGILVSNCAVTIEMFGSYLLVLSVSFILHLISHCCF